MARFAVAAALAFAALAGAVEPWTLLRIRAFGSKRFRESDIVKAAGLAPGDRVTVESFERASRLLSRLGTFSDVSYRYSQDGANATVQFHIRDSERFVPCRFENFVWFTDKELIAAILGRVPLFDGEVAVAGSHQEEVESALESILKSRKLPGSVGRIVSSQGSGDSPIGFRVEGMPIEIGRFSVTGNEHADPRAVSHAAAPLVGRSFERTRVEAFVGPNLKPIWAEIGFLRAAFSAPSWKILEAGPARVTVAVEVRVREGLRYAFAGVEITGSTLFPAADLAARVRLIPGEPANGVELARDLEEIRGLYARRGYLRASIREHPVFDDAGGTVRFGVEIQEGDLYRMGKLEIVGLAPKHVERLAKHWKLEPGAPFDPTYWESYRVEIEKRLPASRSGWILEHGHEVREGDRTVDVTIRLHEKTSR